MLNSGKLLHEFRNHNNANMKSQRGQIAMDANSISDVIETMQNPDYAEYFENTSNENRQQNTFAVCKNIEAIQNLQKELGCSNAEAVEWYLAFCE